MKKLFTVLTAVLLTASMFAQSPQKMSYQAVIRNASNNLVTSTNIGMQISILQGTADGSPVYVETQTPTTNANGLVSIEIGTGTVESGNFTTINWANGPYFIKTETAVEAPLTTYTITGTSQLLSVPYALHANTAETITGGVTESDPVFTAWDKSTGISITESQISDLQDYATTTAMNTALAGKVDKEAGKNLQAEGTQTGQMQYWNGTAWVTIAATTNEGATLQMIGGVPTWTGGIPSVTNPTTGKTWMDSNLGASQVATSSTDANAYGDLYQWGRAADGHQLRTSSTIADLATSDTPGHGNFITNSSSPYDWRNPQNDNLWQGVSGTNNPCPSGYRLPTEAEWEAERTSWSSNNAAGAFASPLKLPVAGDRDDSDGTLYSVGSVGGYWSSTVDGTSARILYFYSSDASMYSFYRAYGFSVRCLKD